MHVLLVCVARGIPLYGTSGASAHVRGVAWALHRAGHRVTVICARLGHRGPQPPVPADVRTLPTPWWPRRRSARERAEEVFAARLMALAPEDADLVWHRHALHDGAVATWARARGVPRWLEVNAPLTLERALLDPLGAPVRARRQERRSVATADRILAVSRWLVPWAQALGASRVDWLPNGTELPVGERRATRQRLGLEGPVVGFVGSCRPWHRPQRLVQLLDACPDLSGLLVGDGPARPRHPRLHHVKFASGQALANAVAAMDVGVVLGGLPWVHPLKFHDYRSQGLPVAAVPVGDTPEQARTWGGTVMPWDTSTWSARIRSLATTRTDPARRSWDEVVRDAFSG